MSDIHNEILYFLVCLFMYVGMQNVIKKLTKRVEHLEQQLLLPTGQANILQGSLGYPTCEMIEMAPIMNLPPMTSQVNLIMSLPRMNSIM